MSTGAGSRDVTGRESNDEKDNGEQVGLVYYLFIMTRPISAFFSSSSGACRRRGRCYDLVEERRNGLRTMRLPDLT